MKSYKAAVIILCIFMIVFFAGMLMQRFHADEQALIVRMQYEVTEKMGFNTDTDALYFGKGYPGSMTKRHIFLNNSREYPVMVSIKVEGDIAPFVSVSENDFIMEPGEQHVVTYFVKSAKETPYGNYTGLTTLIFKKISSK